MDGGRVIIAAIVADTQGPDVPLLVEKVATGDRQSFLELYDQFADRVYGLAVYMLHDEMAAEEVTQETFLKFWNSAASFRSDRGRFSTWLLTIARRTAIDRIRRESRRPEIAEDLDVEADWKTEFSQPASGSEEARWRTLYFSLNELPVEQRHAVTLSYYHGLSHSEIASYLDIPLGTAKTRIRLGLQKLRASWLESESDASKSAEGAV